jgi:hypothetical protein
MENKENTTDDDNDTGLVQRMKDFKKVATDLIKDLLTTFPELKADLNANLITIINNENEEYLAGDSDIDIAIKEIYAHCKTVFPEKFFDILYQNEELFTKDAVEFLPGIDFKKLWNENISDSTRETLWKYLQLILFTVVSSISGSDSFGDTAKLFEAIDETEFRSKLEETISKMQDVFDVSGSSVGEDSLPNPEDIHDHVAGMMDGKLGKLAKEIAEETAESLNMDMENADSVNDVFKSLFKNPTKLMSLVKNVGSRLDEKIKSGDIKESELLQEAGDIVKRMQDMPGMENLQSMLGKMGIPGGGKMNMNAMQANLDRNMRGAQQKDRMRAKLAQREAERKAQREASLNKVNGDEDESVENLVFSTGETVERSSKKQAPVKKKNNKKKKKKNKNKNN